MSVEFFKFFPLVVVWHCQLLTPTRCVIQKFSCTPSMFVIVSDCLLVVKISSEVPNMILVKTMINMRNVGVWRWTVNGLSHDISPFPSFIIVLPWLYTCCSYNLLWVRSIWLDSLISVNTSNISVINIAQMTWVVFKRLMPSQMWHVEESLLLNSSYCVEQGGLGIPESESMVDVSSFVESTSSISSSQAFINSVPVNSPNVFNSLVNFMV